MLDNNLHDHVCILVTTSNVHKFAGRVMDAVLPAPAADPLAAISSPAGALGGGHAARLRAVRPHARPGPGPRAQAAQDRLLLGVLRQQIFGARAE